MLIDGTCDLIARAKHTWDGANISVVPERDNRRHKTDNSFPSAFHANSIFNYLRTKNPGNVIPEWLDLPEEAEKAPLLRVEGGKKVILFYFSTGWRARKCLNLWL